MYGLKTNQKLNSEKKDTPYRAQVGLEKATKGCPASKMVNLSDVFNGNSKIIAANILNDFLY